MTTEPFTLSIEAAISDEEKAVVMQGLMDHARSMGIDEDKQTPVAALLRDGSGAIVGGLIVGLVENVAAGYVDPYVGGGTKDFAPYVLMILALMIRPYGIFGKRIIERI